MARALLALAQRRTVEIDDVTAGKLHGSRPGINLPLHVDGRIAGVVGLTGQPEQVRQFGELVRLTAEMILEQAQLQRALQHDARQREAFVLEWIRGEPGPALDAWAQRLGLRLEQPHVVLSLQLDEDNLAADQAQATLQQLQSALAARWPRLLSAATGPYELVLVEACEEDGEAEREALLQRRLSALAGWLEEMDTPGFRLGMGIALPGRDGAAQSCLSARAAARIGRQRQPKKRAHSYYELALPVLLSGLDHGWQAQQLRQPLQRLEQAGKSGLRRTAEAWFAHQSHPGATARGRCTSTATRWTTGWTASPKSPAWIWSATRTVSGSTSRCCWAETHSPPASASGCRPMRLSRAGLAPCCASAISSRVSKRITRSVRLSILACWLFIAPAMRSTLSFILITVVSASHILSPTPITPPACRWRALPSRRCGGWKLLHSSRPHRWQHRPGWWFSPSAPSCRPARRRRPRAGRHLRRDA
ncbi:hypothetical protein JOS77_07970 [Chromobacterium haemolyticum]|nr:hypothetical protein JOS77_07970 [Chromobacterium haemolyticum]